MKKAREKQNDWKNMAKKQSEKYPKKNPQKLRKTANYKGNKLTYRKGRKE
jgi:hypothetical protein